jgi:hypothetical protein
MGMGTGGPLDDTIRTVAGPATTTMHQRLEHLDVFHHFMSFRYVIT